MENRIKLRSMTVGHPVVSFEDRKLLPAGCDWEWKSPAGDGPWRDMWSRGQRSRLAEGACMSQ